MWRLVSEFRRLRGPPTLSRFEALDSLGGLQFPARQYKVIVLVMDFAGNQQRRVQERFKIAGKPPKCSPRAPSQQRAERYLKCIERADGHPKKLERCAKLLRG